MAALFMAVSMAFPFTACKKTDETETSSKSSAAPISGAPAANATDTYFEATNTSIVMPADPDRKILTNNILSADFIGDLILVNYYQEYEKSETSAENMTDDDGIVQGMALFDLQGNLVKTLSSNWRVLSASAAKDGTVWLLESSVASPDETYVRAIPMKDDGSEDTTREIRFDIPATGYIEGGSLKVTEENYFVVSLGNGMTVFDNNGQKKYSITDGNRQVLDNLYEADGKKYIVSIQYDAGDKDFSATAYAKELDIGTGKFLNEKEIRSFLSASFPVAGYDGIYASSGQGIFKVDFSKGEMVQVFNWNDTDVNLRLISDSNCRPVSENEYFILCNEPYNSNNMTNGKTLIHLSKADTNPHAGKTLVTVGSMFTDERFQNFMYEYNTDHSHKYKIVLVTYSNEPDEESSDVEARILLDLMSTTPPDVLLNFNDWITFSDDSTMVDLNEYIDGGNGIDRSQVFDNVLRSMERDGKLFHIPLSFGMEGFVANPAYISKRAGWTFDEFESVAQSLPQDVTFLADTTKTKLLECLVEMSLNQFVDGKNKTVDFNNKTFRKYLEIANAYGCEDSDQGDFEYEYMGDGSFIGTGENISIGERFSEGMLAMLREDVSNFFDYWNLMRGSVNGEKPFLIGYPNNNGEGLRLCPECTAGITRESRQKEAAWDVIRSFLLYEDTTKGTTGVEMRYMSVNRKALRASCEQIMAFNNTLADEDEKYIKRGFLSPTKATRRIETSDIDEFIQIVEGINCATNYDSTILDIIDEEAQGYFSGSRTAEDVMKNTQSRVNLVIQEK